MCFQAGAVGRLPDYLQAQQFPKKICHLALCAWWHFLLEKIYWKGWRWTAQYWQTGVNPIGGGPARGTFAKYSQERVVCLTGGRMPPRATVFHGIWQDSCQPEVSLTPRRAGTVLAYHRQPDRPITYRVTNDKRRLSLVVSYQAPTGAGMGWAGAFCESRGAHWRDGVCLFGLLRIGRGSLALRRHIAKSYVVGRCSAKR